MRDADGTSGQSLDADDGADRFDADGAADRLHVDGTPDRLDVDGAAELADRTVLVTGGAGFIGSHLVDALVSAGADVRVLDNFSSGRPERVPAGATLIEGDLRDDDALERATADADVIFHQAAIASVEASVRDPERTHDVNATATVDVLERARREDARIVLASSSAVYGHPASVPVAETAPTTPTSPYGVSKLALDRYAAVYADLYDLPAVALRYFNVYGPRQSGGAYSGVIDVFVEQALAGEPITVEGDGTQTRDFVHVRDVVRANLLAATTAGVAGAYNVGTGESVTIRRLAEIVREAAGADVPIEHVEPRAGDVDRSRAAVSKAGDHLGYEPTVPLEDGIAALVDRRR